MHNLVKKTTLAAVIAAACTQYAVAQIAPPNIPVAKNSIPGMQEGVVYPGQPISQATSALQTAPVSPGISGAPMVSAQAIPVLPALPGEISPARQAVNDILPADVAKELTELRRRVDDVMRAGSTSVNTAAKPKSGHVELTQQPNEDPPTVRVTPGVPTNLIFTDVTGAPWPIEYAIPGSVGQFDILLPAPGTPTMQIRPRTAYAFGGVSIKLVDNPIPVSITIAAAQKIVDVRLDVVVLKRGPNAKAPMIDTGSLSGTPSDVTLTSFLYGIAPPGAKSLTSTSRSVLAWNYNGFMYVRSTVPLVSPNPIGASQTVDGTYAYVFTQVPVVNITSDGVISSVSLSE
jgi:intracellular multiplication protein IcmK